MKTSFITKQKLPLVIEPEKEMSFEDFLGFIRENQEHFCKEILKYGGILFRGFPVEGADNFNLVIDALGLGKPVSYIGGDTPRDKVKGKVYTSTEAPPSIKIPLHNEMSYVKNYPRHIYFYCQTPPETGGETIIADARSIYKAVKPEVREQFEKRSLRYISNFYGKSRLLDLINRFQRAHKTWMDAFETDDKEEVARLCRASQFEYKWNKNEWLQVIYNRPAVLNHPETGEATWFNQAHLYDYNPRLIGRMNWIGTKFLYFKKDTVMHKIFFGDGKPIPLKNLYHVMDVLDQQTIRFPWEKGDVMVLDNILAMHGRAPFQGKRRILAALTR